MSVCVFGNRNSFSVTKIQRILIFPMSDSNKHALEICLFEHVRVLQCFLPLLVNAEINMSFLSQVTKLGKDIFVRSNLEAVLYFGPC